MKTGKTENRFEPDFQKPRTGLPKHPALTFLVWTIS